MKKIILCAVTLLFVFTINSCGSSSEPKSSPQDTPSASDSSKVTAAYICPCGHCGYEGGSEPGDCPKCGMELKATK